MSTTFLRKCGWGESLGTTTCPMNVFGGKQGYSPCKMLLLQQGLSFGSAEFHGDHKTVTKLRWIWPLSVLGYYRIEDSGVCLSKMFMAEIRNHTFLTTIHLLCLPLAPIVTCLLVQSCVLDDNTLCPLALFDSAERCRHHWGVNLHWYH